MPMGLSKMLVLMLTTAIVRFSPVHVGRPGKSVSPTRVSFFPLVFGRNTKELTFDALDDAPFVFFHRPETKSERTFGTWSLPSTGSTTMECVIVLCPELVISGS